MRKLFLALVLIAAVLFAFTSYFTVNSVRLKDGTVRVEMMNKISGRVYTLMGD